VTGANSYIYIARTERGTNCDTTFLRLLRQLRLIVDGVQRFHRRAAINGWHADFICDGHGWHNCNRGQGSQWVPGNDQNSPITNGDDVPTNGDVAIKYVIDTFGRRIDFYYESNRLRKVRQDRGGGAWRDYVTIDYTEVTVAPNFLNLVVDPAGMDKIWLPSRVVYPTGNNYRFYYTSYAQMWMIEKWVPTVSGQGDERGRLRATIFQRRMAIPILHTRR
jgi:hypothetical protein